MRRALLALACAACAACQSDLASSSENRAREAFVQAVAEREGLIDRWRLMSRGDLVFEDGFLPPTFVEETVAGEALPRRVPVRWLDTSAHLRLRGDVDMRLRLHGRIDRAAIASRPRVTIAVGGVEIASQLAANDGTFVVEAVVPAARLRGWTDAYLAVASIDPWIDPARARAACVLGVEWTPAR